MMTAESSAGADDLAGLEAAVLSQLAPLVEKLNEVRRRRVRDGVGAACFDVAAASVR